MSAVITIAIQDALAQQLPPDPHDRERVLELGMREWHIERALAAYQRGEGSLAYAAAQAGLSLRELIPLAYAHGLTPPLPADWRSLTLEQAQLL
jgi:hypothetical protein